jgi:hypothetical protein
LCIYIRVEFKVVIIMDEDELPPNPNANLKALKDNRDDAKVDYNSIVSDPNNDLSDERNMDQENMNRIYRLTYAAQQRLLTAAELYSNSLTPQNSSECERQEARDYISQFPRLQPLPEYDGRVGFGGRRRRRRSSKKRATKRKSKRRQRRASRRAY